MAGLAATPDWRKLQGSQALVMCHGGCPDGLGAALLVGKALHALGIQAATRELGHADRAQAVEPGTLVFYVDISPFEEDAPLLARHPAFVLDHHGSVLERMAKVKDLLPNLVDLSYCGEHHCATSLVLHYFRPLLEVADLERKVAILRKHDVWDYAIDHAWAPDAQAFGAFVQSRSAGPYTCPPQVVAAFFADPEQCLALGQEAAKVLKASAARLHASLKLLATNGDIEAWGVEVGKEPYDQQHFIALCTATLAKAVVLRADPSGAEIVGHQVGRSCAAVGDVGAACRRLHERDPTVVVGGGGHPFAAGVQVRKAQWDLGKVAQGVLSCLQ